MPWSGYGRPSRTALKIRPTTPPPTTPVPRRGAAGHGQPIGPDGSAPPPVRAAFAAGCATADLAGRMLVWHSPPGSASGTPARVRACPVAAGGRDPVPAVGLR